MPCSYASKCNPFKRARSLFKGSSLTLGIECVIDNFKTLEEMALENNISEESLRVFKKVAEQFEMILEEIVLLKNKYSGIKFS